MGRLGWHKRLPSADLNVVFWKLKSYYTHKMWKTKKWDGKGNEIDLEYVDNRKFEQGCLKGVLRLKLTAIFIFNFNLEFVLKGVIVRVLLEY